MDKLDLTQPLEARNLRGEIHRIDRWCPASGRTVDVHFNGQWKNALLPSGYIDRDWRVINADLTAKPSTPSNEELTQRMEIAPEVIDRMIGLTREVARSMIPGTDDWYRRAKSIVSDLPKPVDPIDPDLRHAREVALRIATEGEVSSEYEARVLSGAFDDWPTVVAAREGIKLGRTLAAGGTTHERN